MASRRMDRESNGPSRRTYRLPNGDIDRPVKKTRMERETTPANEQYRVREFAQPKEWGVRMVDNPTIRRNRQAIINAMSNRNTVDSRKPRTTQTKKGKKVKA